MIHSAVKSGKSLLFIFIILFILFGNNAFGQEDKKSTSLAVQYSKIMKQHSLLDISSQYKTKNGFEPGANLFFSIYKVDTAAGAADVKIGEVKTNKSGKATFIIPSKFVGQTTSYTVKLENDKIFEDIEESLTVTDVNIEASVEKTDSIYSIKARLLSVKNEPIAGEALNVGLKRLFGNLAFGGEKSYTTDENGAVEVIIDKGFTGIDGKLNFQVIIPESDTYGTVIADINSDIGVPIVDKSTFNERTMWSPPTKTPIFLLIIPNLLLIGIWLILTLLVFNLYKIYKSKN